MPASSLAVLPGVQLGGLPSHRNGVHGKHAHAHMPKAHGTLNRRASNAHLHELEDEEREKRALLDMLDPKKRREAELRYVVARFVGGGWC